MKQKLNILFICSWYPSRVIEGNGVFIQHHAESVQTKQNVFSIYIISDINCTKNIEIFSTKNKGVTTHIGYLKPSKNPIIKFYRYSKAYFHIRKKIPKIDINHVNVIFPLGVIALIEKMIRNTPFIISEHWSGYHSNRNNSINWFEKTITKLIASKASFICPVTKNLEVAMRNFNLKGNYYPIPNIVNTKLFKPKDNLHESFNIIHISDMGNECKNIIGILNVIAKLEKKIPNINFKLIGSNTDQHLKEIAELKIKNITIYKYMSHKSMVKHLQESDLFVLFSNYENLPCVILESFSCGIPVVSTNVGGIIEYFPKDFGILVEPKNEIELEKAILKMYKKTVNKQKLHDYAVKHFSSETISTSFSHLYKKAIDNN